MHVNINGTSLGPVVDVETSKVYRLYVLNSLTYRLVEYDNEHEYTYLSHVAIPTITTLFRPITNKLIRKLYLPR
jgi:hypothetical protein